jgi:hypothetical protein
MHYYNKAEIERQHELNCGILAINSDLERHPAKEKLTKATRNSYIFIDSIGIY